MKVNKIMAIKLLLCLVIVFGMTSCSKKSSSKGGSTATGWKINDKRIDCTYKVSDQVSGMVKVKLLGDKP